MSGYKYRGSLNYGKNGTSSRIPGNTKLNFGAPMLEESSDFFSKDSQRRLNNPNAFQTNDENFNKNRLGWVEEISPSMFANRKGAQSTLKYDNVTLPRVVIRDKEDFDRIFTEEEIEKSENLKWYRNLKYPIIFGEIVPWNFQSSLIFRQEENKEIKSGFDNFSSGEIKKTFFYLNNMTQRGREAILDPKVIYGGPKRIFNSIYANGGFDKTFGGENSYPSFNVEQVGISKIYPTTYNNLYPEGSMLSALISNNLINGDPEETVFSGYIKSRLTGSLGL